MSSHEFKFSHIGIYVHDQDLMENFYTNLLGFTVTDVGELDSPNGKLRLVFMSKDPDEHHQIVLISGRPKEIDFNIINQISLRGESISSLKAMCQKLLDFGAEEVNPVTHGNALSVYALDPEGNRVELYLDLPWYVTQPMRVPVDLSEPEDVLMEKLEKHAAALPGFKPRSEWRQEMVNKMGLQSD